ncbi:MAG: ABC transporter permease [Clostridia bacterium]|nr:ABC transporter permease [Clostridia bacterium]
MFLRMVKGAIFRQKSKMLMIAFTIALGASLATAMLNVMMDVGDKVNQELKTYGANITVVPQGASLLNELYEVEGGEAPVEQYLQESELGKLKTIFWAFNIVDFAPFMETNAVLPTGETVKAVGTWFDHHMDLPTGEQLDTGVVNLRSWWDVDGAWIDDQANPDIAQVMVGSSVAQAQGLSVGDVLHLNGTAATVDLTVAGIFESGDDEDDELFVPLSVAQALSDRAGLVSSIEVSALTTPDNELARKAAVRGPSSLSKSDYETWYCTAYVSSICYQIQEVITNSVASAVRQVADSEGAILEKTQLLMLLITALSLVGSALGISNLVTASVMERSNEIGLMKAIGAHDGAISGLVLTEIIITAILGGLVGYFAGFGFAQIIGHSVFNASIEMKPMIIPIVAILVILITLLGSIPAIRTLLKLRPTEVLHGR